MKILYKLMGYFLKEKNLKENYINNTDIKKVLIINLQGMGDFIMTSPLISSLSKKFNIDLLVRDKVVKKLSKDNVNYIYFYENNPIQLLKKINNEKYDLIFLSHGAGPKSALFFYFLKANYKSSHIYTLGGYKTSFGSDIKIPLTDKLHRVEENLKLLDYLGMENYKEYNYSINTDFYNYKKKVNNFLDKSNLKEKEIIGIHPGGDKSNPQKRYPIEKYCEFVNTFEENKFALFFLGGDEEDLERLIKQYINHSRYFIIKKDIEFVIEILKYCNCLIHSDSGLGHLAASVGIKTYTIVGATNWYRTRPYSEKDNILKLENISDPIEMNMENGFIVNNNNLQNLDLKKLGI